MIGQIWLPRSINPYIAPLTALAMVIGPAGAWAQTVGPDEAVSARGALTQKFGLTDTQKSAIYNAVLQQRVRGAATVPVAVGAPVSPATALAALPERAASHNPLAADLKYAMVEDEVVVVDAVQMRVVEVIRGARP
jgi:hypothetical protein